MNHVDIHPTKFEPPQFVDRQPQLDLITTEISRLDQEPSHFVVLEVVGLGGMGKTSLLEEVWTRTVEKKRRDVRHLWVVLEGEASTNCVGPLITVRDQLSCHCILFDMALITYWNAMGQPLQLTSSDRLADSIVIKALELGGRLGGFVLPVGFGISVFNSLQRSMTKRLLYHRDEFLEIERLRRRPGELLERLPHYLGVDLKRSMGDEDWSVVAFYDGYDRQALLTREEKAPWIRRFISTIGRGAHLLSTRDPLGWDKREWANILTPVQPVEELPADYARALISSRLGTSDREFEDKLITATRRVPFFIETAIASYTDAQRNGTDLTLEDLPSSSDSMVDHFLDHLPDPHRELAIALGSVQVFDEALFRTIVAERNIQLSYQSFHKFIEWYFVESLSPGIYKTHDLFTDFVRESETHAVERAEALASATEYLLERCVVDDTLIPGNVLPILRAVIAGWHSVETQTSQIENLIDIGFRLYDAGYWNELASLGSERVSGSERPIDILLQFYVALTARRVQGIDPALERFAELLPNAHLLGRRELAVDLEVAYVKGLAGDYTEARMGFNRVATTWDSLDPSDRTQVHARMYQGGMLIMDGSFRRSSMLLAETADSMNSRENSVWSELVRYRGHAYRFSFDLEQAEELYLRAMSEISGERAPALMGRLHSNLAETYCWFQPESALAAADDALPVHASLGNQIEIAKCHTARGIAFSKLGEHDLARDAVTTAIDVAGHIGYRAGVAFALQAKFVTEWLAGDEDSARLASVELARMVREMDTYRHLEVVPQLLAGDDDAFSRTVAEAEWLVEAPLATRIADYLES